MKNIYNIETYTNEKSSIVSFMDDECIIVKNTKKVSVKEKTSQFSKTVQKLDAGKEMIYLNDTDKNGWTKVLTYERKFWLY